MKCWNACCDRLIDRPMQNLNKTQTDYCSLYCSLFVKNKLQPIPFSDSKHHKNHAKKFPLIPAQCENCGDGINLGYEFSESNRAFCSKVCHQKARKLQGRRGFVRYQMVKLLRDGGREWWSARALAQVLDNKQMIHTLSAGAVAQHLRRPQIKIMIETSPKGSMPTQYRFRSEYSRYPLVALIRGDFNDSDRKT